MGFTDFIVENFNEFLTYTGFANATAGNLIMIVVGAVLIYLAIKKDFEPLLLIPIGLGIILGNIPFRADAGLEIGLYEDNSVLNIFYQGVRQGWYPPLVFLGIGAMTDFSALIANPKLVLIGASAQFGIFGALNSQQRILVSSLLLGRSRIALVLAILSDSIGRFKVNVISLNSLGSLLGQVLSVVSRRNGSLGVDALQHTLQLICDLTGLDVSAAGQHGHSHDTGENDGQQFFHFHDFCLHK